MNAPSSLQRLRDADPAAHLEPTLTFDQLLAVARSETHDPLAGTPIPQRRVRHLGRRAALVAAAAGVATLVPAAWPDSRSPIPAPTALGVNVDGAAVTVIIPLDQVVTVQRLQSLLDKAHLKAKVVPATADCAEPARGGLPVYDVFVVNGQNRAAQQVTFYPDNIPAGATLVFSLETSEESTSAGWWITDHPPNCVPLSITRDPADRSLAPGTSR